MMLFEKIHKSPKLTVNIYESKMANHSKEVLTLIRNFSKLPAKQRRLILKTAPKELIHALSEASLNILKGTVPLTKAKYSKLKRHKASLVKLANPKESLISKRKIVQQRGGFLTALLGTILPIAASVIGGLVSK